MKKRTLGVLAVLAVAASSVVVACVLADPPPILPIPPLTRPVILHDSTSPSLDEKLASLPLQFAVPVQVAPDQSLKWRVFVDTDPNGPPNTAPITGGIDDGGVLATDPTDASVAYRLIQFQLAGSEIDLGSCHTITIVVAYDFVELLPGSPRDPPGGDRATWFYEPTPDCTRYDAAPPFDASVDDGGLDGGDAD